MLCPQGSQLHGRSVLLADQQYKQLFPYSLLVEQGALATLAPEYLRAIAKGVAKRLAIDAAVPWAATLRFAVVTIGKGRITIDDAPIDKSTQPWVWAMREVLELVQTAARANKLPSAEWGSAWEVIGVAVKAASQYDGATTIESGDDLTSAAANRFSGEAVRALIELALAERRTTGVDARVREQLIPLLDAIVADDASPALAELGRLLPYVFYLTEDWVRAAVGRLTSGRDLMNPIACPFWAGYVLGSRLDTRLFEVLRPMYLSAAMRIDPTAPQTCRWSMTENLAQHVVLAMMHGIASGGDPDRLLSTILDRVPVEDRNQAYWLIYREVTDAEGGDFDVLVPRVLAFWEWRLGCLEALEQTDPHRTEEAVGLTWLIVATRLRAVDTILLARRTVILSVGKLVLDNEVWSRAVEFSIVDPVAAFDFIRAIVLAALRNGFVDLHVTDVSTVLQAALDSGVTETQAEATALIHHLGEQGFDTFGELLA